MNIGEYSPRLRLGEYSLRLRRIIVNYWWSELRDLVDCDGEYNYIIYKKREIKIDGKSVFYKRYLSKDIKYTKDLLYEKTNIYSFNILLKVFKF